MKKKQKKKRRTKIYVNFCLSKNQIKEVLEKANPDVSSPSPIKVNIKTLLTAEEKGSQPMQHIFLAQFY